MIKVLRSHDLPALMDADVDVALHLLKEGTG